MRFNMEDIKYFFAGEWYEDQMHGMGLWTWGDGTRFCGSFNRGTTKQGPGMLMQSYDNRICVAEWNQDEGKGIIYW